MHYEFETDLTRSGRAGYQEAQAEDRQRAFRATFTRGGDLFSWWTLYAESLAEALQAARRIAYQKPSLGALVEVFQVDPEVKP